MGKWNEEAAPNNNLPSNTIRDSKIAGKNQRVGHEFSEELADGGERNKTIARQQSKM
ncbi:hypothetical protein PB1_13664 [Bacillus methanolicus PB1]|uniref:Uncharacterized protein n=1 Tax=Bacillus methanolicus PB1 TaxID=997296 RepID=I3DWI8_BACMT|nr:hypothetical protein [Bacillus methanolicus]EIJ78609.1 hypothetical protein PB1_13664 [Bacillus methanolicus PB1]